MRKSVLVGLVGVILLAVGLVSATWIGPDDWIDSPAQTLNNGGEVAVATNYGLLSQSFPMRVSATAEGGEVFVGIGHVIDADDYLADTTTSQVGWFSPAGLLATRREAAVASLPVPPTGLDWWQSSARGTGIQSVEGSYGGQPVVAVITTPTGVSAPLRVWVGSRWVGAFAAALGMAGLGVALLLLGGWWQWRRRREPAGELPSESTVGFVGTTALLLSVALCASGCTAPAAPPATDLPPRRQLTRDALDGIDVTALAADYNRRNDAANAASSAPNYSTKEWDNVDTELILHSDYFDTAWKRATKDKTKPEPCPIRLGTPYPGPSSAGYPRTVVIPYGWTCGKGADKPVANYAVFVRDHAYSPWLHAAIVGAPDSAPHNPGPQAPDPSVAALFEAATTTIATQLTTGGPGLALPADLVKWRKEDLKPTYWCTDAWTVRPLPGAIRTFSTDKGAVAIASLTIVDTSTARPGQTVQWSKPWSIIYGQPGGYDAIRSTNGLMVVLELVDGEVKLTNWYAPNYL